MAFNEKELSIIKYGLANGKTKEQVTQAITNYRMGVAPQQPSVSAPEPVSNPVIDGIKNIGTNLVSDIKNIPSKIASDIQSRGNAALGEITTPNTEKSAVGNAAQDVKSGFGAAAQGAGAVIDVAKDVATPFLSAIDKANNNNANPLYKFVRGQIVNDVNTLKQAGEAISNTELVAKIGQKLNGLAERHPTAAGLIDNTMSILKSSGEIASTILGAEGVSQGLTKTVDAVKSGVNTVKNVATRPSVSQTIDNHFQESNDVLNSIPKEQLDSMGGIKDLIDRTKTNIVDGLKANGQTADSARIAAINTSKINTLDELKSAINGNTSVVVNNSIKPIESIATKIGNQLGIESTGVKTVEQSAIEAVTPKYNKKLIGDRPITNPDGTITPRVSEVKTGISKQRKVNLTPQEVEAGKQLSKVEGFNPKATSLENYNLVQENIIKKAVAHDKALASENILRPPKEITKIIKTAVDTASQDSLLLQKTDPLVKNYMRVVSRAIKQSDGTLAGERQVQKILDKAYEDAGGKYGNNKGLDQIHRAARNSLIDDMEAKATSIKVKASLKEMKNLYTAADLLKDKAMLEGGSRLEQLMRKFPVATNVIEKAAQATGLGGAVSVFK